MANLANATSLRRDIGIFGASFLALNAMIGAGIFALPGKIAVNAGLLTPWLFLVVGVFFLTIVLCFAELASYYKGTGGPVLYANDAFGPLAGFSTGWAIYLSRATAFAANANVMAIYLASLHDLFAGPVARAAIITIVTSGLTWANVCGVRDGVRTMAVFTFLKVTPLILMILFGLQYVTHSTLLPAPPFEFTEPGSTVLLLIYAYVGFETISVTAGETTRPRKTLPLAYVSSILGTALLYFFIVLVFVSVIPAENYSSGTLVDVGRTLAGQLGAIVITLAAVFSIGGNLAGSILAAPRLIYSMAENRMLPGWFAHVHPRFATPNRAILVTGAMILVLALTGSFVQLAIASSVVRLLGYIVSIASLPAIRRQATPEVRKTAFRLKGGYLVPIAALSLCFWLLAQSSLQSFIAVLLLLAIGWLFYAIEYWAAQRRTQSPP